MNYKLYFELLNLKEKILMYIIPILIIYFIHINYYSKPKQNNKIKISTNIKIQKIYQVDIVRYYEEMFKSYKIKTSTIYFSNNNLNIKIQGNFKKLLKVIYNSKYKILNYTLYKNNKSIYLDLNININKEVKNKNKYLKIKKNPFKKRKKKRKKMSKAIIGNYVLISNKWYTINDKYKKHKIIKINKHSIILKNKNIEYKMDIFDE